MPRTPPALNPLFQVGLNVCCRTCLVIGGGGEAQDKAGRLLDAGADVRLVTPEATETLAAWADEGRLEWRRRGYEPADLDGVFLVMNTERGDLLTSRRIYLEGERRGILVNTYDNLPSSHFGMAALVAAGPLRVSISTSNASPTLAGRLRRDLEALFGDEFSEYLEALARVRAHLKSTEPEFAVRRDLLRGLVEGAGLRGEFALPDDWRERVDALLAREGTKKPGD